jgi:ribosomal protein L31
MIDDDSFVLPDFTKKPASASASASASVNKKTVNKTPVLKKTVFKTPVIKPPVLKPPVLKPPVLKKNVSKKSASAAPPLGLGFDAPPPGPAFTSPPLGVAFAAMGALKKPVSFKAPVDTFTTAKCGQPFCADLRCDEPFVGLAYTLSQHHLRPDVAKDEVRELIQTAMTGIRSDPRHADALTLGENKIRCHKQGHALTDLYLFGQNHALPVIESVTMVDMQTGEINDVHSRFGLVVKKSVSSTRQTVAHGAADRMAVLQAAKQRAELQLDTLQDAHPFFTETKKEHIKAIEDTIEGMLKESKFEYAPELKAKHGDRVKLSDLLQIGISNGVIDPENDFVVVYACRVPDERVLFPVRSPRGSDSEGSVGGTRSNKKQKCKGNQRHKRKTCKRRRN